MTDKKYSEGNVSVDFPEVKPEELKQVTGGDRLTHDDLTPEEEAEMRRLNDESFWIEELYLRGKATWEENLAATKKAQDYWAYLAKKHGKTVQ